MSEMAQHETSLERLRTNAAVMSLAALTMLIGFVPPWFRFESPLAFDQEPEALAAFQRDCAPAGPLTVFTRLPLSIDGIVARGVLMFFLASLVIIVVAALIAWGRGGPLWLVRIAVILAPLLSLIMVGAWLIVGTRVSFGYPYAQTIPWIGWWLTLLALVSVFFSGLNVLKAASLAASTQ